MPEDERAGTGWVEEYRSWRAAVASKMRTFQIPDARPPSESVLALGHEVLASASELLTLLTEPEI